MVSHKVAKAMAAQLTRVNGATRNSDGAYGDELYERGVLSRPEDVRERLHECEEIIERGRKAFYEMGTALREIRDSRLYRMDYKTFEEYCEGKWHLSRRRAYQLIEASQVVDTLTMSAMAEFSSDMVGDLSPMGGKREGAFVHHGTQNQLPALPSSERVARAIAHLTPPQQVHVWQVASERTDGKVTAAIAAQVAEELYPSGNAFQMPATTLPASAKEAARALSEQRRAAREAQLAEALAAVSPAVVEIAVRGGVDDAETVRLLAQMEAEKRESFSEIRDSGYIQPGDELEAVHISAGPLAVKAALDKKSKQHARDAMELRRERQRELTRKLADVGIPGVIYADPPWEYANSGLNGSAAQHYPTMPTADICNLIPASELEIAPNAALFLWVTSPLLPDGLRVMQSWGFDYKASMVAVKDRGTYGKLGFYVRNRHELLLIGTRGQFLPEDLPDSVIDFKTTEHSAKPQSVYSLIERMYPDVLRLEMFARCPEPRDGWVYWGDEVDHA